MQASLAAVRTLTDYSYQLTYVELDICYFPFVVKFLKFIVFGADVLFCFKLDIYFFLKKKPDIVGRTSFLLQSHRYNLPIINI